MNRKTIAIVLEAIPVISAAVSFVLIKIPADTEITRIMILITVFLAFFGFAFFFAGRAVAGEDRIVKRLGVADWIATFYIIGLYTLAIFSFGI